MWLAAADGSSPPRPFTSGQGNDHSPRWSPDDSARVRVEVADDGVGFDPATPCPGHYGLRGIREQAELIRARFEPRSQPGAGTCLVLEFEA